MRSIRSQLIKILLILGVVVFVGGLVAFANPVGSTFANHNAGGLQLTIDSYSIYNGQYQDDLSWELKDLVPGVDKFFNFGDIKPGDTGFHTISIHPDHDAYVCLDFSHLVDDENGVNEPESLVDLTVGGDLSGAIEFFGWRDDGDNVFEVGERPLFGTTSQAANIVLSSTTYPLADESIDEVFEGGETYYVGIAWCAGDLMVDLSTAEISCDPLVMGNEYQTDLFTVDVSLRAVEATSFTNYRCEDPGVDLYLNKHISGEDLGFKLSDFSYRIRGTSTAGDLFDVIAPHDSFTYLPTGLFTIEELVPEGFVKDDWRIGWYGQCERGDAFTTTIEIKDSDLKKGTLYCEADNQYRPDSKKPQGDNGHGNDEDGNDDSNPGNSNDPNDDTDDDGLPPGQQAAGGPPGQQSQVWSQVSTATPWTRFSRTVRWLR